MKNKKANRREFLQLSAAAAAGAALFVTETSASSLNLDSNGIQNDIPVRTLGKTGLKIPILSMGVDRPDSGSVIKAAFNAGVYHFDTAYIYQNGKNEEQLGNFFEGKQRDSFCVSSKGMFGYPLKDSFEKELNDKLDISLKRLKIDYVDIFYTHDIRITEKIKDERIIKAMQKIKAEGKARFIGFSSHDHNPDILNAAIDTGIYDVGLVCYNFKMNRLEEMDQAIERAVKAGMGIIAMKNMAGGTEDAEGKKKINAQACLKFVWKNKNITTVIPGFTTYDQLDECLAAAKNPNITSSEQEYLAALREKEMLYCQQCGKCQEQCPQKLPIPDIMRAYMYCYGYKHAQLSKDTLLGLNIQSNICAGCDTCRITDCPSGFDIAKKIAAIIPITQVPNEFLA